MKYYKVKPEYDQKMRIDGSILTANELYTPKEFQRFAIPEKCVCAVEIPKTAVYFSFSARFSARQ